MDFCVCGSSATCICEISCTCIHHGCLCSECRDLRRKDRSEEFDPPSSYRELAQSSSGVGTCKSSRLPAPPQEVYCPGSSSEVADESIKESESSIPEIEPRAKDLQQVSSEQTLIPAEQKMVLKHDIGTNKSDQPALCSSEYISRKDYFCKAPNEQEKQIYKAISFIEKQVLPSSDDSESSSDEIPVAKEAFDYLCPRSKYQQPKNNQSDSEKLCTDISPNSTRERAELPSSSRSSSGISILELPENEWGSSSQAESHFTGNHLVAISSIAISPNQIDNLRLQRSESTTPTMVFGDGTISDAFPGRSISPIQIITTNPTVIVSPSGELHLLPLQNSQSLRPQTAASSSICVSQSTNSGKASLDSADKVSPTAISPINIQNSSKLKTENREKLCSTLELCTSDIPEQDSNSPCLGKRGNLQEEN